MHPFRTASPARALVAGATTTLLLALGGLAALPGTAGAATLAKATPAKATPAKAADTRAAPAKFAPESAPGFTPVTLHPALTPALSPCTAAGCTGEDPSGTNCADDATTVASFSGASVRVELRYSRGCQSAWARATSAPAGQVLYVENAKGTRRQVSIRNGRTSVWTAMVDSSVRTRACLGPLNSDAVTCTSWG
ncbi:hypothetical protein CFP65_4248 [Kitasatospora sp. MMS16-BH015]|uniref:DUF2690 domain-containing protein n=1 Tax=Kitasatospora sp. MMS16-BH015 TaxID=2018025 RepID=UPI000CA3EBA4|nr:DUF2690 domain-containing protein [Kitasatospora sp. MMS16-BH015]AUG79002.1 hypothetical protein CFP65_4248 [Kitasatospora sp. MMS16-BH015]